MSRSVLETHITTNEPLKVRLRLLVVPDLRSATLLGGSRRSMDMRLMTLEKIINNLTHGHSDQISSIFQDAGFLDAELDNSINTISGNCARCSLTGPPAPSNKISINHVNDKLNEEIQLDFTYLRIRGQIRPDLHVPYMGTGYSEIELVKTRRENQLI